MEAGSGSRIRIGGQRIAADRLCQTTTSVLEHADRVIPVQSYCTGLLLPGDRKSVAPLSLATCASSPPHSIASARAIPRGPSPPAGFFFVCDIVDGESRTSSETSAIAWFAEQALPTDLSRDRVLPARLHRMFAHARDLHQPADFEESACDSTSAYSKIRLMNESPTNSLRESDAVRYVVTFRSSNVPSDELLPSHRRTESFPTVDSALTRATCAFADPQSEWIAEKVICDQIGFEMEGDALASAIANRCYVLF